MLYFILIIVFLILSFYSGYKQRSLFRNKVYSIASEYKAILSRRRKKLVTKNSYGNTDESEWNKEVTIFIKDNCNLPTEYITNDFFKVLINDMLNEYEESIKNTDISFDKIDFDSNIKKKIEDIEKKFNQGYKSVIQNFVIGIVILLIIFFLAIFNNNSDSDKKSTQSSYASSYQGREDMKELARNYLSSVLKDAKSADISSITSTPQAPCICGTVNAKNSFGAYTGTQEFIACSSVSFLEKNVEYQTWISAKENYCK